MFNERPIWYYKLALGVVVFLDEVLKCEEVAHYLGSLGRELEGYSIEGFLEAQFRFGAIILRSNVSACSNLKSRRCNYEISLKWRNNEIKGF